MRSGPAIDRLTMTLSSTTSAEQRGGADRRPPWPGCAAASLRPAAASAISVVTRSWTTRRRLACASALARASADERVGDGLVTDGRHLPGQGVDLAPGFTLVDRHDERGMPDVGLLNEALGENLGLRRRVVQQVPPGRRAHRRRDQRHAAQAL